MNKDSLKACATLLLGLGFLLVSLPYIQNYTSWSWLS